ncbi:MAG: T9SS type A sorting domain-containing protein [Saprospiraceae bacterium]|nr:T9SS type A sorting domain-containing protein [Saprospiraceae bacterium]
MNYRIAFIFAVFFSISSLLTAGGLTTQGTKLVLDGSIFKSGALTVHVYDRNEVNVFTKTIVNTPKGQKINLEKLPAGTYTVKLSDEYKSLIQKVEVKKGQIQLEGDEQITFKPVIKAYHSKVYVNYLNQGKPVIIRITDINNNVLFIEKAENTQKVEKSFNLSNLPTGNYFISVSTDEELFERKITI